MKSIFLLTLVFLFNAQSIQADGCNQARVQREVALYKKSLKEFKNHIQTKFVNSSCSFSSFEKNTANSCDDKKLREIYDNYQLQYRLLTEQIYSQNARLGCGKAIVDELMAKN